MVLPTIVEPLLNIFTFETANSFQRSLLMSTRIKLCRLLIWTAQGSLRYTTPPESPSCTSKSSTLETFCREMQRKFPGQMSHHQNSWHS